MAILPAKQLRRLERRYNLIQEHWMDAQEQADSQAILRQLHLIREQVAMAIDLVNDWERERIEKNYVRPFA